VDEAQAIKNPGSAQAKAVRRLKGAFRLALTGTPIENRLRELWSILAFTLPGFGTSARTRDNARALMRQLGVSAREGVSRSIAQLRVVNGRILGAVLNAVDFRSSAYHGGYGYYYQRFYGEESDGKRGKRGKRRASRVG
jgi:hypothetical protein